MRFNFVKEYWMEYLLYSYPEKGYEIKMCLEGPYELDTEMRKIE